MTNKFRSINSSLCERQCNAVERSAGVESSMYKRRRLAMPTLPGTLNVVMQQFTAVGSVCALLISYVIWTMQV